jgi:hypothetical protein
MSFSFTEIAQHQKAVAVNAKAQHTQTLKEQVHAGQEMAALLDDPRFMRWAVEVQELRDQALKNCKQYEQKLLNELLTPAEYNVVKATQAAWRATELAYGAALTIAKRIVSEGEQAAEELKNGPER